MEYKKIQKKYLQPSGWNPRKEKDEEMLNILDNSIKNIGLVAPIVVRPNPKKEGYYLITAGEQRANQFEDDDYIDCLIRDEKELDAKITSLTENYVRKNVSDAGHEKFISEIYEDGKEEERWKNYSEMSKATGIPDQTISNSVLAYRERRKLKLRDQGIVSTTDMMESRALKDSPEIRKKVLEKRAKGKIKGSGHVVYNISKKLKEFSEDEQPELVDHLDELDELLELKDKVPEPVMKAMQKRDVSIEEVKERVEDVGSIPDELGEPLVEEMKKEKATLDSFREQDIKEDTEIIKKEKGETDEPVQKKHFEVEESKADKQLEKYKDFYNQAVSLANSIAVKSIQHEKKRKQAVGYLKKVKEYCNQCLQDLNEEEIIELEEADTDA